MEIVTSLIEQLKSLTGLDAALVGTVVVMALLLRLARASLAWFDSPHTLGASIALGVIGAVLQLTDGKHTWQFIAGQSIILGVAAAYAERVLRKAADSVPWLPKDNEFVNDNKEN